MEHGTKLNNFTVEMTIHLPHLGGSKLHILKHVAKKTFAATDETGAIELAREDVMRLAPQFKDCGFNTDLMRLDFKVIK